MFMNEYEIDDAVRRWASHPILGPATRTLESLKDAVNNCSDGWAYWAKPVRAAARLQRLVQQGNDWDRQAYASPRPAEPTARDLRSALIPIKTFRTRESVQFDIFGPEGAKV